MSERIETEFSHLPITALAFLATQSHLIVGQGPQLRILDCQRSLCIYKTTLFGDQTIHGIAVHHATDSRHIVSVWGGRMCAAILVGVESEVQVYSMNIQTCSDWILHFAFCGNERQISSSTVKGAMITAHNALILLKINLTESVHPSVSSPNIDIDQTLLSAATRCMLYSAHIHWISEDRIIITAGTPFGIIIVWSCIISHLRTVRPVVRTHYVFTAHENGAIFGVVLIHDSTGNGENDGGLLAASCSDDRTIKIWDISGILSSPRATIETTSTPTTTCAVLNQPTIELEDDHALSMPVPHCYAATSPFSPNRLYGHISRIWKIGLISIDNQTDAPDYPSPVFVSLGEDATAQFWHLNAGLSHFATYKNHFGKNIWSFATTTLDRENIIIATGGSDGAAVATKLVVPRKGLERRSFLPKTDGSFSKDAKVDSGTWLSKLKTYSFVGSHSLLATSLEGHVLLGKEAPNEVKDRLENLSFEFQCATQLEELDGYSTTTGLPSLEIGFVAGTSGKIYCYNANRLNLLPIAQIKGKVGALFSQTLPKALDEKTSSSQSSPESIDVVLLVAPMRTNYVEVFILQTYRKIKDGVSSTQTGSADVCMGSSPFASAFSVLISKSTTVTSMVYVHLDHRRSLLMLGARDGTVAKYVLFHNSESPKKQNLFESQIPRVETMCSSSSFSHHQDAVTCMQWSKEKFSDSNTVHGFLLSTGRDSTYAIHRHSLENFESEPELVHRITLPFGPNIEGLYFAGPKRSMYLYGFRGEDFVVFDNETNTEKMKVHCGGAHRQWSFQPSMESDDATFVWTRASKFYSHTASTSAARWLQPGGHGREIKACAICPKLLRRHERESYLIATGAEDTEIRLFEYSTPKLQAMPTIRSAGILRKHVTGLQHLRWSADGRYLFSSGGREEFYVWKLHQTPFVTVGVVCESKLPPISTVPDLRIMGFDVKALESTLHESNVGDYAGFLISMVLSNSTTRIYRYDSAAAKTSKWQLLAAGEYATSCLTIGEYILHSNNEIGLITAGTDGSIAAWELPNSALVDVQSQRAVVGMRNCSRFKIHQNTIKCLQSIPIASSLEHRTFSDHLVVAGGDDNALSFSLVRRSCANLDESLRCEPATNATYRLDTVLLQRAHAASITGLVAWKRDLPNDQDAGNLITQSTSHEAVRLRVVSISNDQRLKVWDVDVDWQRLGADSIQVTKVENEFSGVADVSSIAMLEVDDAGQDSSWQTHVRVLVCGVGMEVWRIPRASSTRSKPSVVLDTY